MRVVGRAGTGLLAAGVAALVLAACDGVTTPPTAVTQTGATLHGSVTCAANTQNNPCTAWFQYWPDGSTTVHSTSPTSANANVSNLDFNQAATGLIAGTLYHYQLCGYGDNNISPPGYCDSPAYPGGIDAINSPGSQPDAGDLSATQNFRTATSSGVASIDLGRVLSTADTKSNPISRDDGLSVSYASGQSLWLFGDSAQRGGPSFISTGTAAEGPVTVGQAPTALNELPTPPAAPSPGRTSPAPFFPTPQNLQNGSGGACTAPAAWASGATMEPGTSTALLTYGQVCEQSGIIGERSTLVEYNPTTNQFGTSYTPFAASPLSAGLPTYEGLSSPLFQSDGYLYFYAGVTGGGVSTLRVKSANHSLWGSAANYQWWSQPPGKAVGWYTGLANAPYAVSVLPAGVVPVGGAPNVNDYSATTSKHLVMMVETFFGAATFQLYEATSPKGPWTAGPASQAPDACTGGGFGCYALVGHPELTSDSQFVFSWYSADDIDGFAHLRIGEIAW